MLKSVVAFLDAHAVEDWRLMHKWWTVRLSILWAAVAGLWVALPAFMNWMPAPVFALLCVGFSLSILFARITSQPGLPSV